MEWLPKPQRLSLLGCIAGRKSNGFRMRKVVMFPIGLLATPEKRVDFAFQKQINALAANHWFAAVSNNPKPRNFDSLFKNVTFLYAPGLGGPRQNGKFVAEVLKQNQATINLKKSQVVMLGFGELDVPMYVNSRSVLIRCDWRADIHQKIKRYGVPCVSIDELPRVLKLLNEDHPWYLTHEHEVCDTYCLINAATRVGNDKELQALAGQLQSCLKDGRPEKRSDFITTLLSSLYATDVFQNVDHWTYYPSSRSSNNGGEIIFNFVDLARTTFSRKRRPQNPMFIRHTRTAARHSTGGNREDPESQILSIHLHPDYKNSVRGATVAVLDDYTTTGVSFSVASAFLRKAGATKVLAVAMGKFPRSSFIWDIELLNSPFSPVKNYRIRQQVAQHGTIAPASSEAFKRKFT